MLVYALVILAALILFILILFLIRLYLKLSVKKCKCRTSLAGKVAIVTGANSGIGYHTAFKLAAKGARVILACRNENRALTAVDKIRDGTGNSKVLFKILDLTSLKSVHNFAADILKTETRIDILINNAGACALENDYTKDGILEGMQVNHFGPFLLTTLLIPILKASRPSRIVNVSTLIYFAGFLNLEKINEKRLNRTMLYADSKLCNLQIHQEFARRLAGMDITVNSAHPGIIMTNILGRADPLFETFFKFLCWMTPRTAEYGAETVVHLAISKECGSITGKFFIDCKDTYVLPKGKDPVIAKKLWKISEDMVKEYML